MFCLCSVSKTIVSYILYGFFFRWADKAGPFCYTLTENESSHFKNVLGILSYFSMIRYFEHIQQCGDYDSDTLCTHHPDSMVINSLNLFPSILLLSSPWIIFELFQLPCHFIKKHFNIYLKGKDSLSIPLAHLNNNLII